MIHNEELGSKPFDYAMSLIQGKWKMHILFFLSRKNILRYTELKKSLGSVTHKMLSNQLKELEKDGLIIRKEYPQIPPKVEYSLSEKGLSLIPIMKLLCKWGDEHMSIKNDIEV
ncbi:winged helix-turn-helix transcriptional regulator [Candidatus Clostridium helianthi]|uniref:Winged helix-turn-helix transcriptional regulator n=1 Tax=Candidatus Clostridium helianthi TaxID=3381660 RepID=A0ABW8S5P8_9CLOT